MHFSTTQVITAITGLLALASASPLVSEAVPDALVKRACPADCNNGFPLSRKAGAVCGGDCDKTYRAGSETCSCNLGAILLCRGGKWQIVADCGKAGQKCFNNRPGDPTGGRSCERK